MTQIANECSKCGMNIWKLSSEDGQLFAKCLGFKCENTVWYSRSMEEIARSGGV